MACFAPCIGAGIKIGWYFSHSTVQVLRADIFEQPPDGREQLGTQSFDWSECGSKAAILFCGDRLMTELYHDVVSRSFVDGRKKHRHDSGWIWSSLFASFPLMTPAWLKLYICFLLDNDLMQGWILKYMQHVHLWHLILSTMHSLARSITRKRHQRLCKADRWWCWALNLIAEHRWQMVWTQSSTMVAQ